MQKINNKKSTVKDMTSGPIVSQLLMFAIPLLLGNGFQILYNTVDALVVGNFVGKEALAAVGSTSRIVNIMVFFFNGLAIGGSVVIGQFFGAKKLKELHRAVETTIAITLIVSLVFTVGAIPGVPPMLELMSTPADVMPDATTYLRIYFAGCVGLLIYNMGSGILRAVGDTTRPLIFLVITSIINIILDLFFVLGLHMGIAGAAYATIISEFVSAVMVMAVLIRTEDIYYFRWRDLCLDMPILKEILAIGFPAGFQSVITSFSNAVVQGYVNHFGSSVMAGWSCYDKLDQLIMLPQQSMMMASTTFVSQNVGAKKFKRVNEGTWKAVGLAVGIITVFAVILFVFARPASAIFTSETDVIEYGGYFIRCAVFFSMFNTCNHVLAGALRGRGDAKGPMVIMLICFVAIRQVFLFIGSHMTSSLAIVAFAYPVGWVTCCAMELLYYASRRGKMREQEEAALAQG